MPGGVGAGINSQGIPTIAQLVNHFAQHYEVEVFMHASPDATYYAQGFKLHSPSKGITISSLRWLWLVVPFATGVFKKKYSAVVSFWGYPSGTIAVVLGKLFSIPSIVFILGGETADLPQINYGLLRKPVLRRIVLWTCRNCTSLLAISHYQINQLKKYGFTRDAVVIPWGADKNLFRYVKKEISLPLKIIHIANLNPVKDQETLIKAFALIQKNILARLKIVGPDTMNGKIQKLVADLNLEGAVEFVGGIPYELVPSELAQADMFILTSLSEGQNNAITEAMTCGLLAVSTRVGIMSDLGDNYGIVVDVGDYQLLAARVIEIANDLIAWQTKVKNSLEWSTAHDLSWTLQKLDEHLSLIINSKS